MYQLERGSRKFRCPSCGEKRFVRYVSENGSYLDDEIGRCDRESSCGYHLTPKSYFEANGVQCSIPGVLNKLNKVNALNALNTIERKLNKIEQPLSKFGVIDNSFVTRSLERANENHFLNYLLSFIDVEYVQKAAQRYLIGTAKGGRTVFWQIDTKGKARTGKIIAYNPQTGKRDKSVHPSWIHYELKRAGALPQDFEHRLCFFGEHLLTKDTKPIAIVEAEKTALVASIFLDNYTWLAVGGKSYLKAHKLLKFKNRKIVLFPDADGYGFWSKEAEHAKREGLNITVSRLIEDTATPQEKAQGYDLADYLLSSEKRAVLYDYALDAVQASAEKQKWTDELIDERLAIIGEYEEIDENYLNNNLEIIRDAVRYAAVANI